MKVRFFSIAMAAFLMLVPARAQANGGPPRGNGDSAAILPGRSATIHVVKEHLRFEVGPSLREARVTARYDLANRSAGAEALPVLFVIQDAGRGEASSEPSVTWQGRALAVEELPADRFSEAERLQMREAWGGESRVIDPVTGEVYPFAPIGPASDAAWRMRYFRFQLAMEPGASGALEVTYYQHAAFDRRRHVYLVYQYQYLLLPARGWASFGPLEIAVAAPPASRAYFASNHALAWSDGAYRATLDTLPADNLLFSFMSRKGIILGLVKPAPYYLFLFALALDAAVGVALGLGRLAALLRSGAPPCWPAWPVGSCWASRPTPSPCFSFSNGSRPCMRWGTRSPLWACSSSSCWHLSPWC